MHRPEVIGHRGAPREHPENTMPSFRRAIALGADALELDVHATADGVVVVHHDPVPRAVAPSQALAGRPIARLTAEELRGFRFGGDVPIPTLAEVLAELAGAARLYVEVKARGIEEAVVAELRSSSADCAVHCFDHRVVRRVRELAPELPTGVLMASYLLDPEDPLRRTGARDYWLEWTFIDAELVRRVHDAGGRVIAWTVNDLDMAVEVAAMGVDGLCTDNVPALEATLSGNSSPVRKGAAQGN